MLKPDYTLYLVTDRNMLTGKDLLQAVGEAVKGGVTIVQLREKEALGREFYNLALALSDYLAELKVPLIINDRVDIALAVDAAGVHIGQEDIPLKAARQLLAPDKIIGLSVSSLEQAREGINQGADYLGVGPVFATATKKDIDRTTGVELLSACRRITGMPLVAIGGIDAGNSAGIKAAGADGIAVVSALLKADDIAAEALRIKKIWQES